MDGGETQPGGEAPWRAVEKLGRWVFLALRSSLQALENS